MELKSIMLFLLTTFMFVCLAGLISKSLEIARKPIEGKPKEIKVIHEKYIFALNLILVSYIYFLVICYLMYDFVKENNLFDWFFVFVNFTLAFSTMVIASDTRKKLTDLNALGEYKDYLKMLDAMIAVSTILVVVMLTWVGIKYNELMKNKTKTTQTNS